MKKKVHKAKKAKKTHTKKKSGGARKKSGLTQMTYSVSADLEAVIGTKKSTRPQIVKKLWEYIKRHKCQDMKNRRMICPDSKLSAVLGSRPIDMLKIATALNKHIKK